MKCLIGLLAFFVLLPCVASASPSYTGTQAIGFANWAPADVQALARDYLQTSGDLELSYLPFEFNPADPFGNAANLIATTLPHLNGRLRITAYLWFHSHPFDWAIFRPGAPPSSTRTEYLRRVAAFDAWAKAEQLRATRQGLGGRLSIVLCPYLEDDSATAAEYQNLLNEITRQQRADLVTTPMRRSPGGRNFRVVGLPLEIHGRYDAAVTVLRPGDTFSNDGNFVWFDSLTVPGSHETANSFTSYGMPTSVNDFIAHQRRALGCDVSVLFWQPAWNGLDRYPSNIPPSQRRNLVPLTGAHGTQENYALLKVLHSR